MADKVIKKKEKDIWKSEQYPEYEVTIDEKDTFIDFYVNRKFVDDVTKKEQFRPIECTIAGMLMTEIKGKSEFTINHYEGKVQSTCTLQVQKYAIGKQERTDLTESTFEREKINSSEIEQVLTALCTDRGYVKKINKNQSVVAFTNIYKESEPTPEGRVFERFAVRLKLKYYDAKDGRTPTDPLDYQIESKIKFNKKAVEPITRKDLWELVKGKKIFAIATGNYRARYVKSKQEVSMHLIDPVVQLLTVKGRGGAVDKSVADAKLTSMAANLVDDDEVGGGEEEGAAEAGSSSPKVVTTTTTSAAALADKMFKKNEAEEDQGEKEFGAE